MRSLCLIDFMWWSVNEELNKVRKQPRMTVKGSKFILLKNGVNLSGSERVKLKVMPEPFKTVEACL
ncbi:hypothetical protein [Gloeocapsopsis dulcis]|uniref:hypothetical protein n=1 Tax=Gloeocapsopsis dulcis TaxID=2859516 RepID=UPI00101AED38|nr:hypothetical protein [Gloeocapsopsis dulcis]WNN92126.1 hypothetical protein P0S91_26445 [Gloeocapsopsis dulcis]